MDYYTIAGMVAVGLIAILGFLMALYNAVRKNTIESQKPIYKLDNTVTELTTELRNMRKFDENRDSRIKKHGEEIDELQDEIHEHELKLTDHENRIKNIERRI